ncbi:zinc ribbon domain-containing protein [Zoogloea sp.]|uniref:zinc ribbon domain-containing protein n=1 Tax=Zoogloea sp. TaxID=49181 RepID=UPI0014161433|nr:MAG: zinc ribbon domain-containing protein [Zoogloea sp.]
METKCPHCQSSINSDQKFCSNCGKATNSEIIKKGDNPHLIVCPACGKDVGNTAKHCPHCGTPIKGSILQRFIKSNTGKGVALFALLQLLSQILLTDSSWKLSQFLSLSSYIFVISFIVYVNRGKKIAKTAVLLIIIAGLIGIFSLLVIINNAQAENEGPVFVQKAVDEYWSLMTVEVGGYRYAIENIGTKEAEKLRFLRMPINSKISVAYKHKYLADMSTYFYPAEFAFPHYEYSDADYYSAWRKRWYNRSSYGDDIFSGGLMKIGNERKLIVGKELVPISKDTIKIKEILRSEKLLD